MISRLWPLLILLLFVDLLLVAFNLASIGMRGSVRKGLSLGVEANVPTWWSSVQLLLAGCGFLVVAMRICLTSRASVALALLGFILVAMSLDEVAMIHEWVGGWIDGATRAGTALHYTGVWFLVIGAPFAAIMAVLLWRLRAALSAVPGTIAGLTTGLTVLLLGALGIEALSNFVFPPELRGTRTSFPPYLYTVTVEEGLELIGGSLVLWTASVFMINHPSFPGLAAMARPQAPRCRRATNEGVRGGEIKR